MIRFTYATRFHKHPIETRLGDHLLSISLPGKPDAVFFRNNIKKIISSGGCHQATAVLLNMHNEKAWEIELSPHDIIEKIARQFREDGLEPIANFIKESKSDILSSNDDLVSYWNCEFKSRLMKEADDIGLLANEDMRNLIEQAIRKHNPARYTKAICPTAINFIENIWPNVYSEIRSSLI